MKIDQIIRSKRKTISITIELDGRLVIRAPQWATEQQILSFVSSKADWIRKTQAVALHKRQQAGPKQYVEGEEFLYLGKTYQLRISPKQRKKLVFGNNLSLSKAALPEAEEIFTAWYRQQARKVITGRVEYFARKHGFNILAIRINSAKTRWGSCGKGLNFIWRLIMAPIEVVDYVVVHELAHTKQKNHSRAYWKIVSGIMPDYKKRREWLTINGHRLTL